MVSKYKRVHTARLGLATMAPAACDHVDVPGADLWTPAGDITIIGTTLRAMINPLMGVGDSFDEKSIYVFADVSLIAKMNEAEHIVQAHCTACFPELATIGEHVVFGDKMVVNTIMFPEGYGQDTNEWHPVYLNIAYRNNSQVAIELTASATIYYVERA